ncbi:hypothetical protein [Plantibacter sp. M259]|uniref:hypothetical protein n=1 Tax=Plantibacter sp. M259 TaxID=2583822 RepID=UPI001F0D5C6E|nr:hypothetical protein [Plantibacter sp. M259]
MNGILVQLTALHSPAEVVVSAIVSPAWSNALSWVKWLPHASSPNSPLDVGHLADSVSSGNLLLAAIEELVQTRLQAARAGDARRGAISEKQAAQERGAEIGTKSSNDTGTKSPIPAIVLLISDDVGVDRARLVQLAEIAADAGSSRSGSPTTSSRSPPPAARSCRSRRPGPAWTHRRRSAWSASATPSMTRARSSSTR